MGTPRAFAGVVMATVLGWGVAAHAQSAECRAKCERWGEPCIRECADAPIPEDCKANCKKMFDLCLSQCTESSSLERNGNERGAEPSNAGPTT
jgi:hypothetical protein